MILQSKFNSQYTEHLANLFANNNGKQGSRFLIYRDIEALVKKYIKAGKALDFGCGPGFSTRILSSLGFDVIGVDICKEMLLCAFSQPDGIPFAWMEHGKIPFKANSFDLVLAIMVLLEEPSLEAMRISVKEIYRVLKPEGIFFTVVASEHMHKHNWTNRSIRNVENNQNLKTGDTYTTYSNTLGINFTNFVYFHSDYQKTFEDSGLQLIETYLAMGKESDGILWALEKELNPFTYYVCRKH
jgi:SAM-dependent methyltransferase